ncbi:hypothetical protein EBZ80_02010 [bacterium]|nr:hypothetical protein [bacterium]
MSSLLLDKTYSDRILTTSVLLLGSSAYSFREGVPFCGSVCLGIFATSVWHWSRPVRGSLAQRVDRCMVAGGALGSCFLKLRSARRITGGDAWLVLGLCLYAAARVTKDQAVSSALHCAFHLCGHAWNRTVVLATKDRPPRGSRSAPR